MIPVPKQATDAWAELTAALAALPPVACATSATPDAWWPDLGDTGPTARQAQDTCQPCPARAACLAYARAAGEEFGVWGGTLPGERRTTRPATGAAA